MDNTTRLTLIFGLIGSLGVTLALSELRWFSRPSFIERLRPFTGSRTTPSNTSSLRQLLLPSVSLLGERLSTALGVIEPLEARLVRADIDHDVQSFRMRQLGLSSAALAVGLLLTIAMRPPLPIVPLLIGAPPLLVILVLEQHTVSRSQHRQQRVFSELPVLSEQLAMLLSAGYSVGAALARLAERNTGASGKDLKRVCKRIRHGLSVSQSLNEWAAVVNIPELNRLVDVLSLSTETSDLGSLVSAEAKAIRKESQRRLNETMEKRAQQVWIPVTVATLVPGVIFLMIPFLQALKLFSAT